MMQLCTIILGVHALIRREDSGDLAPVPREQSGKKCEHRVFHIKIPTDIDYPDAAKSKFSDYLDFPTIEQDINTHLDYLIETRALSIDRNRNIGKNLEGIKRYFEKTNQWKELLKMTEGEKNGKLQPFVNFEPLKTEASVWGWFAGKEGGTEPILVDVLRGFFGEEDYAKIESEVGDLKWGKYTGENGEKLGNVHLDFPYHGKGLTMWLFLPLKMVKLLDADAKQAVKMRFSFVQIKGDEALIEAVSEITTKTRVKEVFQTNGFRQCDKMMMNDLHEFIATEADEDSTGRLKDLFGAGEQRKKNHACVVPDKVFNPQIEQKMDDHLKAVINEAIKIPGGVDGVSDKGSKYNTALKIKDEGTWRDTFKNLANRGESYTHSGDIFARWYFYVMQQCHYSSAASCPTCQKYNSRWGSSKLNVPFEGFIALWTDDSESTD